MKNLFARAMLFLVFAGVAAGQPSLRKFKGEKIDDRVLDSLGIPNRKILVTDYMSEINNNFTKEELKRGYRGPYYVRFNLRDSKLRCLLSKYDLKNMERLEDISKNDRVTVIGQIDQLAMGIKRFSQPYFILKVSHIEPGWILSDEQNIFSNFPRDATYAEVSPHDIGARSEEYAGEYLKIKDRFSMGSTFFTTFERDLNLNNESALKFYLENSGSPCYMPNTEKNRELLATLRSGAPVMVYGRLNVCPLEDDALLLFSVSKVKLGW
jgi:hypothetical protein